VTRHGAEQRFPVAGDVDIASSGDLQDRLLTVVNATTDDLVLDCAGLDFIDSTGVGVFLHTQRLLEVQGRHLRVENLRGMARRTFDILGLVEGLEGRSTDV
jgi:anti-sigma B factor antagonist